MRTVLIAHRDPEIATSLEADFRRVGYHINTCPGPFPPNCAASSAIPAIARSPMGRTSSSTIHPGRARRGRCVAQPGPRVGPRPPRHSHVAIAFTPAEVDAAADVMARAPNVVIGAQDRSEMLLQVDQLMTRTLEMLRPS